MIVWMVLPCKGMWHPLFAGGETIIIYIYIYILLKWDVILTEKSVTMGSAEDANSSSASIPFWMVN